MMLKNISKKSGFVSDFFCIIATLKTYKKQVPIICIFYFSNN